MLDTTRTRIRSNHEDREQGTSVPNVETLIRDTHTTLNKFGVRLSPSKVTRACRDYVNLIAGKGPTFGQYLANIVRLDQEQARAVNSAYRRLTYADPTGETATGLADGDLVWGGARID